METTKRKGGRPRKFFLEQQPVIVEEKKPATEARRVVVAEEDEGDDEPNTEIVKYPLFAGAPLGIDESSTPQHLLVSREGPVPEGHLGRLEPTATEADLKAKWGGGTYRIEARTAGGRAIKGGVARLIVAGEPFLQSDMAQLEYRRQMMLMKGSSRERTADTAGDATERQEARPALVAHAAPMPAPAPAGMDSTLVALITAMMTSSAQTNQTMLQLVTEGAKQRETSQWEMFKLLASNKESGDPMEAFREGMKLMRAIGGGGGEKGSDVIDRVLGAAGPILDKVASVVRAEKGTPAAAPAPAPAPKPPNEAAIWAAMNEIAARPDCMLLEGALGTFANQAISHLISIGVKAEIALANIFKFAAKLNLDEAREMGLLGDVAVAGAPAPAAAAAPEFVAPANANGITSGPVASPIS